MNALAKVLAALATALLPIFALIALVAVAVVGLPALFDAMKSKRTRDPLVLYPQPTSTVVGNLQEAQDGAWRGGDYGELVEGVGKGLGALYEALASAGSSPTLEEQQAEEEIEEV